MRDLVSSRLSAFVGSGLLAIAGFLAGVTPAFAHNNSDACAGPGPYPNCDITASIVQAPASGSITFSNATQTNDVKYHVVLTHYSTRDEAFAQVKFVGDTTVVAAAGAGTAKIIGSTAPTVVGAGAPTGGCVISADTHVVCTFNFSAPYFKAKGATIAFDITIQSPTAGPTQTAAGALNFKSTTSWSQPGCPPESETFTLLTTTSLGIPDPKVVQTFLPAPGAVTTGTAGGAATCAQPWVTIVKVPASASVAVDLNRDDPQFPGTFGNFSKVAIPGQQYAVGTHWYDPGAESKLLVITLRRDKCTIGDHDGDLDDALQILKEKIFYRSDDGLTYNQVLSCFVTSGPTPGNPCIARRQVYLPFNLPPASDPNRLQYLGDHEWVIYANENGRYQN